MTMDIMLRYKEIQKDERGEISVLYDTDDGGQKEITILKTNKGFARGGCIHRLNNELSIVIKGKIRFIGAKLKSEVYIEDDMIWIDKGTPHYFVALEDSITIEWGATLDEKKEKDKKMRKIVDEINKKRIKELKKEDGLLNKIRR